MLACSRAVRLAKTFKHIRQKLFAYAVTSVRNFDVNRAAALQDLHAHAPAAVGKFHRV